MSTSQNHCPLRDWALEEPEARTAGVWISVGRAGQGLGASRARVLQARLGGRGQVCTASVCIMPGASQRFQTCTDLSTTATKSDATTLSGACRALKRGAAGHGIHSTAAPETRRILALAFLYWGRKPPLPMRVVLSLTVGPWLRMTHSSSQGFGVWGQDQSPPSLPKGSPRDLRNYGQGCLKSPAPTAGARFPEALVLGACWAPSSFENLAESRRGLSATGNRAPVVGAEHLVIRP